METLRIGVGERQRLMAISRQRWRKLPRRKAIELSVRGDP